MNSVSLVIHYHQQTKHHPKRYARSLGFMDWANQPNPFRSFEGARKVLLDHPPLDSLPTYDGLFLDEKLPSQEISRSSISRIFFDSLALSAWKQARGTRPWSLRINPSSGALHPTEGYLVSGPIAGIANKPGVYHYLPYHHGLERRSGIPSETWETMAPGGIFVGLTSIYWRESWKYGERAFRYCHHDVGHAIGTITFAARMLGWRTKLVPFVSDEQLGLLLGTQSQTGIEAEHPDCLLAIWPDAISNESTRISDSVWDQMKSVAVDGRPYQLSKDHYHWPIIDEVSRATAFPGGNPEMLETPSQAKKPAIPPQLKDRGLSAQQIIRQRRSAVDMDGRTSITGDTFYHMLARTIPHPEKFPFSVLPWQPKVSLAIFVNRVEGLPTGLYMLVRHPSHRSRLASCLHSEFEWLRPSGCPPELELYLLTTDTPSRVHRSAKVVSCGQDIAADGAFALGMIAEFESTLNDYGPWFYPRLHWETGLIGQVLYLEAEAAGIRATGIGCFFDDVMHEILGIQDLTWQSLYHFTVGGAVEDSRLKTIPPYAHLT